MSNGTEQATESPEKSEQTGTPPGITEAISRFEADQAKLAAEEKSKEAPSEDETQAKAEEKKPEESTKPEKTETKGETEEGEKKSTPSSLTLKVAGKEVTLDLTNPEDVKKLETWSQQGYDFSQRNQSLGEREALISTKEAVLKAVQEGKLVPVDQAKPPEKSEQVLPEVDFGDLEDDYPEAAKYLKGLKEIVEKQQETITLTNQALAHQVMSGAFKELKSRIAEAKKEYHLASDDQIWNMLKETKEDETGQQMPVYTPEEAVRISHENIRKGQEGHIEKEGYVKLTDELKEQIILEAKAKEAELNKAPVSSPSGLPAGTGAPPSDDKKGFKGITDAINAFSRDFKGGASKAKNF